MSVAPFHQIDAAKAAADAVFFSVPSERGDRTFLCMESYCSHPTCDCQEVILCVAQVDPGSPACHAPEVLRLLREIDAGKRAGFDFRFDLSSRKLSPAERKTFDDSEKEVLGPMEAAIADPVLAAWRSHKEIAREWGKTNWWRLVDWSDVDPGCPISFASAYPATPRNVLEHEGARYLIDDLYCVVPGCLCKSVFLSIAPLGADDKPGREASLLRLAVQGGRIALEKVLEGKRQLGTAIFRAIEASEPGTLAKYMERRRAMKEVSALIEKQWKAAAGGGRPAKERLPPSSGAGLAGMVPRNSPCPCGSGRKYKNCCGQR